MDKINKTFLKVLACPRCGTKVMLRNKKLVCQNCRQEYQVRNSVPIMLDNKSFKNNLLVDWFERERKSFENGHKKWLEETRTPRLHSITSFVKDILLSFQLKNKRILELGCGVSPYLESLLKKNEVFAGDLSYPLLRQNPQEASLIQLNIANLPFYQESFDFVYMVGVLHHLPPSTHKRILREINKILRKGGRFLLVEPNFWSLSGFFYLIRRGLAGLGGQRLVTKLVGFGTEDEQYLDIFKTKKLLGNIWQIEKFYTIKYLRIPPIKLINRINLEPLNYLIDKLSQRLNLALFGTTCIFILKKR